jgi:hypothetical protein
MGRQVARLNDVCRTADWRFVGFSVARQHFFDNAGDLRRTRRGTFDRVAEPRMRAQEQ